MVNKSEDADEPPHSPESTMLFIISLLCAVLVMFVVFNFVLHFAAAHSETLHLFQQQAVGADEVSAGR